MQTLYLPTDQIYTYQTTGKFEAPTDEWMHARFPLAEYELFAITKGTLYLKYGKERFTVKEGEYLLLPPSEFFRQGFEPSRCAFYWLHFSVFTPPTPKTQVLQKIRIGKNHNHKTNIMRFHSRVLFPN